MTANANVPISIGVPVIAPLTESSVSPLGSAPETIDHRTVPVPPLARSTSAYAVW